MSNKYLNPILIVVLIIIWGGIVYKYFGNNRSEISKEIALVSSDNLNYVLTKDTFKLELNNRNPFKISKTIKSTVKSTLSKNKNEKKVTIKEISWPKIQYYGFVKSANNKTKLALLKINGRLYKKREKDKIEELIIVKAYSDSIKISLNRIIKTIIRL